MCVIDDKCLGIYNHNRPVNIYSYDPKDGHRNAKTVDATVGYQDLQSGQKFMLVINQAICIDGLDNHLLWPMQWHVNGVHINEFPKFLVEHPSETTHVIELVDPFNTAHPLIIPLQLSGVTSYFDVYSPSVAEYENEDIPKVHFTAEKLPCDSSTSEYSERETWILNHQDHISISATAARGQVYVSTVVSYLLAYNAVDVMENYKPLTALSAQVQISISLIGTVRKPFNRAYSLS